MGRQLEIIAVSILLAAIAVNFLVFSGSTFNVGFTAILALLFLFLSGGLIYWVFFTSSGKEIARDYNATQKKIAEKQAQDFKEYYRNKSSAFSDLGEFNPSYAIFSTDGKSAIAIDENSKSVCLLNTSKGQSVHSFDLRIAVRRIISYRDILEASIFEDGNSLTTTSRTSQVAGAVVGNLMLGGAGLLIGALSGSKKTSSTVSSLEVRLLVNDTKSPTWSIAFICSEIPKKSATYKKYASEAENLPGIIKVLIKRADDEDKIAETRPQQSNPVSPAPAMEKGADVLESAKGGDSGAITSLLNRSLNKKGITAKAKTQGSTLRIALASENTPDPDHVVPLIHKGIMGLNIDSVENVEVLGYRLGESSPNWSRTLQM
jgi:hypothetical protein